LATTSFKADDVAEKGKKCFFFFCFTIEELEKWYMGVENDGSKREKHIHTRKLR
jgi:hypothetical protein